MNSLISTYRFQFHSEFQFSDLQRIIPYLQKLGIGTVYASPIFASVPGSTHGYDGLDPNQINPEIGSLEQLHALSDLLKAAGINWLQDIVPNHMAFDPRNGWLLDVLEKGPQSLYASFFDIAWTSSLHQGRLMVPFLGATLQEVIERGELKIDYVDQRFVFRYFDSLYPLQPLSYSLILQSSSTKPPDAITQLLSQIPKMEEEKTYSEQWDETRSQLAGLEKNAVVKKFIQSCIHKVSEQKDLLFKIEAQQSYRLCHWQETDSQINYRRFFTVNGLICLNIQDEGVFETYHQLIRTLLQEGVFQGLRIDHIDGLYDPLQYLQRLRTMAGEELPIVVEKILEPGESLPASWPVQGNSGYDFLSLVNNLFTWQKTEGLFTRFYRQLVKDYRSIHEQLRDKKAYILYRHMGGELDNLYHLFRELNLVEKKTFSSIRTEELKETIGEFLIQCPVYRYYGTRFPLEEQEASGVREILNQVRSFNTELRKAVDILEYVLLQKPSEGNEENNNKIAHFYQRCMQFTGPLMAKGMEDTLMYTHHRFTAHNEVGDSPASFGIGIDGFHQAMQDRQQRWPYSLNATSTHDTKRGEDVRARMNLLSDLGEEWLEQVKQWQGMNADLKKENAPDANDEYFIYQTLAGAFPMPGEEDRFAERMEQYMEKALREAKTHSNWTNPDIEYESATKSFVRHLLHPSAPFLKSFEDFQKKIVDHGIINSLSQLVLKFTCPGLPDVYQGCELWDLSLVDPDNRRPVDYEKRNQWMEELSEEADVRKLWPDRYSGKIKLWMMQQLFQLRQQNPELFSTGEYIPLRAEGTYKEHVIAFARKYRQNIFVVALPLHTAVIAKEQDKDLLEIDWKDTKVQLPEAVSTDWQQVLRNETTTLKKSFSVAELFKGLPLALLKGQRVTNERGAGILLHISSLPSAYGIGDLGPEARAFADFLNRSRQKYWQLLPLSPTEEGQGHSPYSSISSRAGNILFISPDLLVREGLLPADELHQALPNNGSTDYRTAEKIKSALFERAWQAYREGKAPQLQKDFAAFEQKEKEWLNDFALYALLKQLNDGKPWYEWKDEWKFRDVRALQQEEEENRDTIQKIKWLQLLFSHQWQSLKTYCNNKGIQLIGDMPFYVSYDSADVWAHRHLFALDERGNRTGLAGVPPDAFSADGQLWGMPVFNWEAMKEEQYGWWVDRLRRNMEVFDIVRLDHFRAFSSYWEVPAGEATAKNGTWKSGPGSDFFLFLQKELGVLPFVAEDLGEIDEAVYQLRDEFALPGMKVLQFAFGGDMPRSVHIPHNYEPNFIVYTGTHDNNTSRGWFTTEANEQSKLSMEAYVGRALSAAEVTIVLIRMAYASVASIAIIPLQDVLNLDERARMNTPSSGSNNWSWRLLPGQINGVAEENLRKWTRLYNRE